MYRLSALLLLVVSIVSTASAAPMLSVSSTTVDDDNLGNSVGNGDGIVDAGETIELFIELLNTGDAAAESPSLTITSYSSFLTPLFNLSSGYPDIGASLTGINLDDFDFSVDANAPAGSVLNLDLSVTFSDAAGVPYTATDSVSLTVGESSIPEPTTLALIGLGLAGLGYRRKKPKVA